MQAFWCSLAQKPWFIDESSHLRAATGAISLFPVAMPSFLTDNLRTETECELFRTQTGLVS